MHLQYTYASAFILTIKPRYSKHCRGIEWGKELMSDKAEELNPGMQSSMGKGGAITTFIIGNLFLRYRFLLAEAIMYEILALEGPRYVLLIRV